jgi:hypothetical protein
LIEGSLKGTLSATPILQKNSDLKIRIKDEDLNDIAGKKEWRVSYFSTYSRKKE